MYERVVKRGIDILLSSVALVVFSWLYLIIALAIKIDDPGPAFFVQKRVGKGKKLFDLYKFRSMKMSTPHDTPTHLLSDPEQYITKVGRFLRKSSLDEIPLCVRYRLNGQETDKMPFPSLLDRCEPVIETMKGWKCDISSVRNWWDLPEEAQAYVKRIERAIGVIIRWISVGPERHSIIIRG